MKNLKMIDGLNVVLISIGCLMAVSCQKETGTPLESSQEATSNETPAAKGGYLVFGHVNGFCMNCDVLYKIENDTVYATKFGTNLNPGAATYSFLKVLDNSSLAASLPRDIPTKLLRDQNEFIGAPRADVGHYYIGIKTKGAFQHWYIEAANVPDYLTSYLAEIQKVMSDLK